MRRFLGLVGVILIATGCGALDSGVGNYNGAGDFGATPGGVQDLAFARSLVTAGQVPPAASVLVEAMFSEHDLPINGAPCTETLCLRGAVGAAPSRSGAPSAWAQVGMSSTIDPDKFVRPPLAMIATVDVSGSMGWGYGNNGTPGDIARVLLHQLQSQLDADDRFALVTYGTTASTALTWTNGADPAIATAIDALHEDGSTNMEAGLQVAFDLADHILMEGREARVLLFTDTQPNVGATSASQFETMVAGAASKGVGLSVLGLGQGMGADVLKGMSHLRGGNAFTLMKPDDVPGFMSDNWPWFVVPIAYDLHLSATATSGLSLRGSYGFPEAASGPATSLDVSTVFLSKRRGGLLLELGKDQDAAIAQGDGVRLHIAYSEPSGVAHEADLSPAFDGKPLDARGVSMPQAGVSRTVSLAVFTAAMCESLEVYASTPDHAIELLSAAIDRLAADAAATGDADLQAEADFWPKLRDLMEAGASQGDLYGGY